MNCCLKVAKFDELTPNRSRRMLSFSGSWPLHLVVGDHDAEAELQPVAAGREDVVRLVLDQVERLRDEVHAAELDLACRDRPA